MPPGSSFPSECSYSLLCRAVNFGLSLHILPETWKGPCWASRHLHIRLLSSVASSFHHSFLKFGSQEGRGVLQLLGSTERTGVHGAPCCGAPWWEGTTSTLCPGPPALLAGPRRGSRPPRAPSADTTGPQKQLSITMAPCGPKNKSWKRPAHAKT